MVAVGSAYLCAVETILNFKKLICNLQNNIVAPHVHPKYASCNITCIKTNHMSPAVGKLLIWGGGVVTDETI